MHPKSADQYPMLVPQTENMYCKTPTILIKRIYNESKMVSFNIGWTPYLTPYGSLITLELILALYTLNPKFLVWGFYLHALLYPRVCICPLTPDAAYFRYFYTLEPQTLK